MTLAPPPAERADRSRPRDTPAPPAAGPAPTPVHDSPTKAPAASRGVWVFADQGLVSLANFAAPVLVGRFGGQDQLGVFVLGYSIYMFALSLARAVIWTAYTSRAPRVDADRQATLAGSATTHLAGYVTLAAATLAVGGGVAWLAGSTWLAVLLGLMAPCCGALLLREHVRRLCLARMATRELFVFDLAVAILQVGLLAGLAWTNRITAASALVALASAALLATGWLALRGSWWRVETRLVRADWRESWRLAKWLTAGATAVQLGNQGYRWLLPVVASVAELGRLGAAQLIGQVTNPLVIGVSNYLGPASAGVLARGGKPALWRYTLRVSAVMLTAIVVFLAGVAVAGVPLVRGVFGDAAEGVTTTLLLTFAAGVMSEAMLIPIEFASVNLGRTRLMFQTALVRLGLNATLGFALVSRYGATAIGVGMLSGSVVAILWQWVAFHREVRRG